MADMVDLKTEPAAQSQGVLTGHRKIAVLAAAGAAFGFGMAWVVGLILNTENLIALSAVGLCLGCMGGAILSRLMDHQLK